MSKNPVLDATARYAGACQSGDPVRMADAKQGLIEAKLLRAITDALTASPPLEQKRCDRLAAILSHELAEEARRDLI